MRFFASPPTGGYAQNDSTLGDCGHLGGVVLRLRRKTTPPKCKSIQVLVIPMRSEESQTVLI
jgi:hypothetical protein